MNPPPDLETENRKLRFEIARLQGELEEALAKIENLENLAHEDPLTELLNRRGFLRDLSRAVSYRRRYGTSAALLIGDLDGLKPINDEGGHESGDEALKLTAEVLRRNVRASDTVGRIGGDEFALIIWKIDAVDAARKAQMLAMALENEPFPFLAGTRTLSISIGFAMIEAEDNLESVMARADAALYVEKQKRGSERR